MLVIVSHFHPSQAGNTKWGSITVPLTSCLTGLDKSVLQKKKKIVTCHTADSEPVKPEVNGTVTLPPLVFPGACTIKLFTAVIVADRNKRECLPLPITSTLA